MLQNIHDKAKGWVAYLIIFLISIPFALFGINSYLGGGANRIVAEINGEEIQSSIVNAELLQLKQQFAQLAGFDDTMLKQMALDRVVSRTLLEQEVKQHNYRVSDSDVLKEITQIPAFHKEGQFDKQQYQQIVQYLKFCLYQGLLLIIMNLFPDL
jgi:peptidyl-prolyl cis-trans isomerase D